MHCSFSFLLLVRILLNNTTSKAVAIEPNFRNARTIFNIMKLYQTMVGYKSENSIISCKLSLVTYILTY